MEMHIKGHEEFGGLSAITQVTPQTAIVVLLTFIYKKHTRSRKSHMVNTMPENDKDNHTSAEVARVCTKTWIDNES